MTRERELECVIADLTAECQTLRMQLADTEALEISHGERIEKQRETIAALKKQRDELLSAVELYEEALKASWPSGAEYDAFEYWNYARKAIANVKENGGMTIILDSSGTPKEVTSWSADEIIRQRETIATQAAVIEKLKKALKKIALDDCCTDFAAIAQEAIASVKEQK